MQKHPDISDLWVTAHGPFKSRVEAEEWATGPNDESEWWVVEVQEVEA